MSTVRLVRFCKAPNILDTLYRHAGKRPEGVQIDRLLASRDQKSVDKAGVAHLVGKVSIDVVGKGVLDRLQGCTVARIVGRQF